MSEVRAIILCEGETDQTLIGLYLESISDYSFCQKSTYSDIFSGEEITWYKNKRDCYIGIWDNNGNNFEKALDKISYREKNLEHIIECIVVVTDNDDEFAQDELPKRLYLTISTGLGKADKGIDSLKNNEWVRFKLKNPFGDAIIDVCYLLVPSDKNGALETYMLDALTENDENQAYIIGQVKSFISDIDTKKYLQHRRDKTKATLGVAISIFNPERIFWIMNEILKSVDWGKYKTSSMQFAIFNDFLSN